LSVEASSTYRDDQDGAETWEWDNRVMLMMRWNLYSGGRDAAGKREAVARLGQSKFERSVALLQAEEETRQSWNALRASQRRTGLLTDAVGSSRAENEVFVVSSELVDSQTVECFQQYRILALTGGLLRSVDVAAPATTDETPPSFEDTILVE
jgi:adhesin transport system outer membrane protein